MKSYKTKDKLVQKAVDDLREYFFRGSWGNEDQIREELRRIVAGLVVQELEKVRENLASAAAVRNPNATSTEIAVFKSVLSVLDLELTMQINDARVREERILSDPEEPTRED